jgi:hypothetical protein
MVAVPKLKIMEMGASAESVLVATVFAMAVIAHLIFGGDAPRTDNRTVNKDKEFDYSRKTYSGTHAIAVTAEVRDLNINSSE